MNSIVSRTPALLLLLLLAACGTSGTAGSASPGANAPVAHSRPARVPPIVAEGHFSEYPLPQSKSMLMRPAVDHQGRVWVGEMNANCLAVFDPRTQRFRQMTPPNGQSGIMGVAIASDDTVWFAEQYANYIGRYVPASGRFDTYSLPTVTAPDPGKPGKTLTLPSAPNDLAFDSDGVLWFTEANADAIGRLDPRTGVIQHYHLPAHQNAQALNPYGVAVDRRGAVWFTESTTNRLGRLDPPTGQIRYFTVPGADTQFMEVAADAEGGIWATAFSSGLLVKLDPATGAFTSYYAPTTGGLYGLAISRAGEVWVAVTKENAIARLDAAARRFVYYPIPTGNSVPFGVVAAPDNAFWFSESGSDRIGRLTPEALPEVGVARLATPANR